MRAWRVGSHDKRATIHAQGCTYTREKKGTQVPLFIFEKGVPPWARLRDTNGDRGFPFSTAKLGAFNSHRGK